NMGLPGLNAFVGEFAIMQGTFSSPLLGWPFAGFATLGVILVAAYMLRMFRLGFMGEVREGLLTSDLDRCELALLGGLALLIVVTGLYPTILTYPLQATVETLAQHLAPATAALSGGLR
ncbi:MAG: NADH-quinone oxidoreductase subunit M, partial [Oscillochloris sp.]|nr:NADH-quinone oxidoreductase subunit M [Oscillochloris sp.]